MATLDATVAVAPAPFARGTTAPNAVVHEEPERVSQGEQACRMVGESSSDQSPPAALRDAFRAQVVGAATPEERAALHAQRRELAVAELLGELTPAQARHLRMLRWKLDLLELADAKRAEGAHQIERALSAQEAAAERIQALVRQLQDVARPRRRS